MRMWGISGAKGRDKRPGFDRMYRDAAAGRFDVIMAWAIDRVGRSVMHVCEFMSEMGALGISIYLHQQAIDTSTPAGKAMVQIAGVFAEFERSMIVERIHAGLARVRKTGTKSGKLSVVLSWPRMWNARFSGLRERGSSIRDIAHELSISPTTVAKVISA